jgi:hypothetical protein
MNIQTLALTVCSPRTVVFNFLADIENLPKWAGGWCEKISLARGRWWAFTAEGEQVVDMETNTGAGVIDLRAGPSPERMTLTPIRVIALSPRRTLVSFVLIEAPDQESDAFGRRCQMMRDSLEKSLIRFGGGEMHLPESSPRWLELGLN